MRSASSRQSMTAIWRFDAAFLIFEGMHDHFGGVGDFQNVEDDESELVEDEAEDSLGGNSNFEILL